MIFRRKPKSGSASPASADDEAMGPVDADATDDDPADDDAPDDDAEDAEDADPWAELDASRDWRDDGPFDIDEVELADDEVPRLDLGSLIITPAQGMQLQIIADPETGQGMALVAAAGTSAIQVTLYAAPVSPGFATDLRADMVAETEQSGGSCEYAEGPFGTELRRVVPATDDAGNSGMAPLRDWYAQGPRWLLNGRLMGQAAIDTDGTGEVELLDDFFRNLIVRRGDGAMVPGQVIGLTLPAGS